MARREAHEKLYDNSLDRKNRRIYFGSLPLDTDDHGFTSFAEHTVDVTIKNLNVLVDDSKTKPIELHMCSGGGCAVSMLRLVDYIEACPCQIKFYGSGEIMSAATWVMAVCDERYLFRNTQIMLHHGTDGTSGPTTDNDIYSDYELSLRKRMTEIMVRNSRMSYEFYDVIMRRDLYVTPEEAIQLGIADFIVEPKKRGNLRKKRIIQLNKHPSEIELKKLVSTLNKRIKNDKISRISVSSPTEYFDKDIVIDIDPQQQAVSADKQEE